MTKYRNVSFFFISIFIIVTVITTIVQGKKIQPARIVKKSKNSNNDDLLDIHMLPHAHCDTGWLQTVQGYYDSSVHSINILLTI